jgi:chaperonin GroEL
MLVANFEMKTFNALVVRASSLLLEDIAGYTGASLISDSTGVNFQNFTREDLGLCKKIVSNANKTLFIGNGLSHKEYAKELQVKAEGEPNIYTQKNIQQRVDKLQGGIAVLRIGASTDFDREYLKYKAEDAVKAVQSALAEGIVEGGGIALWKIAQEINPKTIGEEILKKSLTAPLKKIIENADKDYAEIVIKMPKGMGYDAKKDKYVDMLKVGIIDPSKVERCALENAISASATFITTGTLITDINEKTRD